jgi:hypothetical protein
MMRMSLVTVIVLLCTYRVVAQETAMSAMRDNNLSIAYGRGFDITKAVEEAPRAVGIDYFRRLDHRWEVGLMADMLFYREPDMGQRFIGVAVGTYALIIERWYLLAGLGFEHEFEQRSTRPLLRLGTEVNFFLDANNEWALVPGFFGDVFKEEVIFSATVAVAYHF